MKIGNLKANPKNPRKVKDAKLVLLKKTLAEFGDLSGIIFNRTTKQLVGGHQRTKVIPKDAEIVYEKKFSKPTKVGTVAEGYVLYNGERIRYREVAWDETKEKAANVAANKGVGEWDLPLLSEMLREIDEFGFDLDMTIFDKDELSDLLVPTVEPNFEPGSADEQGKLDEKKQQICPHCGEAFTVAGRV